jgi:predicted HicB family RNase H-like nuclease
MTFRKRKSPSGQRLSEHFTVSMTPGMLDRLAKEAERRQVSTGRLVRELIEQMFKSVEATEEAA